MKNLIFFAKLKKTWIFLATKLKFMRALILEIFENFLSSSKKIPSLILSKIRLLGKDCSNLVLFIREEDISIKRLIFFVRNLPSYIIKDLKSMSRISSYISVSVIGAVGLALLIIVALDTVGSMIDGAGDVTKEYNFFQVLIYVALTTPGRIYEFLPTAALIGCLVGLGGLANNSELIVIRAAGVSVLRIVWMVLRPILLLVVIGVMFGEYIVPHSEKYAESRRMLL
ncbi:MAG: LptF/LptG family permease, partial [Gammaproteobacteria bacterium]|nr:LptF/LptG family permease [Gammaproteobacteria bacterium]